jgi:hypothetical protein
MIASAAHHEPEAAPFAGPRAAEALTMLRARLSVGLVLKALTVCQPYAELLLGPKRVENRSWPTRYRGLVALHAGKGTEWMSRADDWVLAHVQRPIRDLEYGAVIGLGWIETCVPFSPGISGAGRMGQFRWLDTDPFASGPYCWIFKWALRLPQPVEVRGAQGLWNLPQEALGRIVTVLAQRDSSDRLISGASCQRPSRDGAGESLGCMPPVPACVR